MLEICNPRSVYVIRIVVALTKAGFSSIYNNIIKIFPWTPVPIIKKNNYFQAYPKNTIFHNISTWPKYKGNGSSRKHLGEYSSGVKVLSTKEMGPLEHVSSITMLDRCLFVGALYCLLPFSSCKPEYHYFSWIFNFKILYKQPELLY